MRRRYDSPGFALLITILLVALASVTLVAAGRTSCDRALTAARATREFQRRWTVASIQRTLLPLAEEVLAEAETPLQQPRSTVRLTIRLSGNDYDLLIGDEQAKVNVNALYPRLDRSEVDEAISWLVADSGGDLTVRLRPYRSATTEAAKLPALGSLGQIFDRPSPGVLIGDDDSPASAADSVTCWGDGRLNIRRASADALLTMCSPTLGPGQIDRLVEMRAEDAPLSVAAALDALKLEEDDRDKLTAALTESSGCHSLWIVQRDKQRVWYYLTIAATDEEGRPVAPVTFRW